MKKFGNYMDVGTMKNEEEEENNLQKREDEDKRLRSKERGGEE